MAILLADLHIPQGVPLSQAVSRVHGEIWKGQALSALEVPGALEDPL